MREFAVLLCDALPNGTAVVDVAAWQDMPEVVEDGTTFAENALKKALETSLFTGLTTLADDSGLEVDALYGNPGVHSARYAPEGTDTANNALLIHELRDVPSEKRTARYVAVIALCIADDELGQALRQGHPSIGHGGATGEGKLFRIEDRLLIWFRATCEGRIIDEARGEGGFGYDPHFWVDDFAATMAEVPLEQKNERSHRARAVAKLKDWMQERRDER
jgi:XTP/dITP diphosphohydrolase